MANWIPHEDWIEQLVAKEGRFNRPFSVDGTERWGVVTDGRALLMWMDPIQKLDPRKSTKTWDLHR